MTEYYFFTADRYGENTTLYANGIYTKKHGVYECLYHTIDYGYTFVKCEENYLYRYRNDDIGMTYIGSDKSLLKSYYFTKLRELIYPENIHYMFTTRLSIAYMTCLVYFYDTIKEEPVWFRCTSIFHMIFDEQRIKYMDINHNMIGGYSEKLVEAKTEECIFEHVINKLL